MLNMFHIHVYIHIYVYTSIYYMYTYQNTHEDNTAREWILEALHVVSVSPGREPLGHLVKLILRWF